LEVSIERLLAFCRSLNRVQGSAQAKLVGQHCLTNLAANFRECWLRL
jgi:hypothetical protein